MRLIARHYLLPCGHKTPPKATPCQCLSYHQLSSSSSSGTRPPSPLWPYTDSLYYKLIHLSNSQLFTLFFNQYLNRVKCPQVNEPSLISPRTSLVRSSASPIEIERPISMASPRQDSLQSTFRTVSASLFCIPL